ncbi:hypothetical protein R84B8_01629 [Treponema sp. R8-4-B8]
MAGEAIKPVEACTLRKPNVNRRNVNLNGGKEIILDDRTHNPSADSILLVGFERSIQEYSEIGTSFLKKE